MARPLRYEAAGAIYHVMARGDGGRDVFETDLDRQDALKRLEAVCGSYGWRIHAWVLMGNHFHLLIETPEPNLVKGTKWWLGVFSQGWNRRRKRRGHVFQGRYLESRAKDREAALSDESLKELRRGWYLGEESFGRKVAAAVQGKVPKKRASVSGAAVRAHDEAEASRVVKWTLDELGLPQGRVTLMGWGKWQREKALICAIIRKRTGVSNGWLAERLSMGHASNVTRALRLAKETRAMGKELKRMEQMLEN